MNEEKQSEWVNVNDRLPKDTKDVLIIDANEEEAYYGIGSYREKGGLWCINGSNYWLPTHWMPMPKPPVKY